MRMKRDRGPRPTGPADLRFVLVVTTVIMTVSSLPYLYAYLRTPPGMRFLGWLAAPLDQNAFLAWIRQGMEGRLLFGERFTTEPHHEVFIRPLWLGMGIVSRITGIEPVLVYHAGRIASAFLLLVIIYKYASLFLTSRLLIRSCVVLTGVAAGLGWIFALRSLVSGTNPYNTIDLYSPEAVTFRSMHSHTHFAFAVFLMLGFQILAVRALETGRWWSAVGAGLVGLLLGFEHPYDMITLYGVLALTGVLAAAWRIQTVGRLLKMTAVIAGISCFPFLYNFYFLKVDPVFQGWAAQNVVRSPAIPGFILGFGLLLIPAAVGLGFLWRRRGVRSAMLISWLVVASLLIYSPFSFQLKFIQGTQVPICLLATMGVAGAVQALRRRRPGGWFRRRASLTAAMGLLTLISIPTNLAALVNDAFFHKHRSAFPVYLPTEVMDGLAWLRDHGDREGSVLCSSLVGNLVPGWSGNRVYVGHWSETLRFDEKEARVQRFFAEDSPAQRREFLCRERIRYVFVGPEESRWGRFEAEGEFARRVFARGDVSVFEVDCAAPSRL